MEAMMRIDKCVIGVVKRRGAEVIDAQLLTLGAAEADYFVRHVEKVRKNATSRAVFVSTSTVPDLLAESCAAADGRLVEIAKILQELLVASMRTASNAKDCVFGVIRGVEVDGTKTVNLLKLDAVIEAARFEMLRSGELTFEVLHQLLPEPGELQKGLSWPDARPDSDVMMVDRNAVSAMYFENAFEVAVSLRSVDAERDLVERIVKAVPRDEVSNALQAAASLSGPANRIARQLSQNHGALARVADEIEREPRPPGIIRPRKVSARRVVWRADGVEISVPPDLASSVTIVEDGDVWEIRVRTRSRPSIGT